MAVNTERLRHPAIPLDRIAVIHDYDQGRRSYYATYQGVDLNPEGKGEIYQNMDSLKLDIIEPYPEITHYKRRGRLFTLDRREP